MSDISYEILQDCFDTLKIDMTMAEFARFTEDAILDPEQINAIEKIFKYLGEKKIETTKQTIFKMSRLPLKDVKTFENFDFSIIKGKDIDRLKTLPSLSAIYSRKNLAFIGPAGTGKTHLAQAFGYECCMHGMKTYFIKMSELRDKFTQARRTGKEAAVLNGLVRPTCLIVDEVGHCEFDKENTRLFFDLIDRRYNRESFGNIVFTSNKNPALWRDNFNEDDALLCALDRIFDDATVFNIKGESYRGRKTETVSLSTSRIKSTTSNETKEPKI